MSETLPPRRRARERPPTSHDPLDIAMEAVAGDSVADSPARTLLINQNRLVRWQIRGERIGAALKLLTALGALVLAAAAAALVWRASHSDSLVIEAFDAPPDLAARGVSGKVLASLLLDKLDAMQRGTILVAVTPFSGTDAPVARLDIGGSGISLDDLDRYLRRWLGHERHITGSVYRTSSGLVLTARTGQGDAQTVRGAEDDLDPLVQKLAEGVYAQTQPNQWGWYLLQSSRNAEAGEVFRAATTSGSQRDQALAYNGWGVALEVTGSIHEAAEKYRTATRLEPDLFSALWMLGDTELELGHDESALANWRAAMRRLEKGSPGVSPAGAQFGGHYMHAEELQATGAMIQAAALYTDVPRLKQITTLVWPCLAAQALAMGHDRSGAASILKDQNVNDDVHLLSAAAAFPVVCMPNWALAEERGDWAGELAGLQAMDKAAAGLGQNYAVLRQTGITPHLALAMALTGDVTGAERLIATTPLECYLCVRMRGRIAALKQDRRVADHWFSQAARMAPSLPMAHSEWGQFLLASGDPGGAAARFMEANKRGPHFADPLEGWGEALMAQGDFDGAAAKFTEANRYAPKWDRLHQKWGEALTKLGKADEARAQTALAASLMALNR